MDADSAKRASVCGCAYVCLCESVFIEFEIRYNVETSVNLCRARASKPEQASQVLWIGRRFPHLTRIRSHLSRPATAHIWSHLRKPQQRGQ